MCEHFVLNDRGVVVDVHLLNGHARHFAQNEPSESVHEERMDIDEVKLHRIVVVTDHDNPELLLEGLYVEWLVQDVYIGG